MSLTLQNIFINFYSNKDGFYYTNDIMFSFPLKKFIDQIINVSFSINVNVRLRGAIGSAFASRAKGCVFESRRGHLFFQTIGTERRNTRVLRSPIYLGANTFSKKSTQ